MQTSAAELRYNLKDVMLAVERNEPVTVLYHGKPRAEIRPIAHPSESNVRQHPFFAMIDDQRSVEEEIEQLRGSRY